MEVAKLTMRSTHSLSLRVPPVIARMHGFEPGTLFEITATATEIRYRKLSQVEVETLMRAGGKT